MFIQTQSIKNPKSAQYPPRTFITKAGVAQQRYRLSRLYLHYFHQESKILDPLRRRDLINDAVRKLSYGFLKGDKSKWLSPIRDSKKRESAIIKKVLSWKNQEWTAEEIKLIKEEAAACASWTPKVVRSYKTKYERSKAAKGSQQADTYRQQAGNRRKYNEIHQKIESAYLDHKTQHGKTPSAYRLSVLTGYRYETCRKHLEQIEVTYDYFVKEKNRIQDLINDGLEMPAYEAMNHLYSSILTLDNLEQSSSSDQLRIKLRSHLISRKEEIIVTKVSSARFDESNSEYPAPAQISAIRPDNEIRSFPSVPCRYCQEPVVLVQDPRVIQIDDNGKVLPPKFFTIEWYPGIRVKKDSDGKKIYNRFEHTRHRPNCSGGLSKDEQINERWKANNWHMSEEPCDD